MQQLTSQQRRLLIITYHFPPSGAVAALRMLGFARHLPRYGWQVGVVSPMDVPGEPVDEALAELVPQDTALFRVPYPNSLPVRAARRWLHHGVWLPRALPGAIRAILKFQPDAVLSSGPPHCVHVLGLAIKRLFGLPWAASFRDPWYTNFNHSRPPSSAKKKSSWGLRFPWAPWEKFWEKRVFAKADCIIANTPLACEGYQSAFPKLSHKMTFLTNGFDPEFFPAVSQASERRQPALLNDSLTILHAGEIYWGRDPRPLFDALRSLLASMPHRQDGQPPLRLRLLGQATEGCVDLRSAIRERGLDQVVELTGTVPYAAALEAMTRADVLLLIDTPGRKMSIPAKLYEYFGAGRPILALAEADGDVAWALRASGVPHRLASPLDADKIEQAIVELRGGLRQQHFTQPAPEKLRNFTRAKLAQDLASLLDTALGCPLSAVNHEHSASGCRPSAVGLRPAATTH